MLKNSSIRRHSLFSPHQIKSFRPVPLVLHPPLQTPVRGNRYPSIARACLRKPRTHHSCVCCSAPHARCCLHNLALPAAAAAPAPMHACNATLALVADSSVHSPKHVLMQQSFTPQHGVCLPPATGTTSQSRSPPPSAPPARAPPPPPPTFSHHAHAHRHRRIRRERPPSGAMHAGHPRLGRFRSTPGVRTAAPRGE